MFGNPSGASLPFLSPGAAVASLAPAALLDRLPVAAAGRVASTLARGALDRRSVALAREDRQRALDARGLPIRLAGRAAGGRPGRGRVDVLQKLFYLQLRDGGPVFLDHRPAVFTDDGELVWCPQPLVHRFGAEVRASLVAFGDAVVGGAEPELAAGWLRPLGVQGAPEALARALGLVPGCRARRSALTAELPQALARCQGTLHPELLLFGLALSTWTELLEGLAPDEARDGRRAWCEVATATAG